MAQDGLDQALGLPAGRTYSYEAGRAKAPAAYIEAASRILGLEPGLEEASGPGVPLVGSIPGTIGPELGRVSVPCPSLPPEAISLAIVAPAPPFMPGDTAIFSPGLGPGSGYVLVRGEDGAVSIALLASGQEVVGDILGHLVLVHRTLVGVTAVWWGPFGIGPGVLCVPSE